MDWQFILYIAFGLTSAAVGLVGFYYSYRNNFGRKPIIEMSSHHAINLIPGRPDGDLVMMDINIHNRLKQAIFVRELVVEMPHISFKGGASSWNYKDISWEPVGEHIGRLRERKEIEASKAMWVEFVMVYGSVEDQLREEEVKVTLRYFMPSRNKTFTVVAERGLEVRR